MVLILKEELHIIQIIFCKGHPLPQPWPCAREHIMKQQTPTTISQHAHTTHAQTQKMHKMCQSQMASKLQPRGINRSCLHILLTYVMRCETVGTNAQRSSMASIHGRKSKRKTKSICMNMLRTNVHPDLARNSKLQVKIDDHNGGHR